MKLILIFPASFLISFMVQGMSAAHAPKGFRGAGISTIRRLDDKKVPKERECELAQDKDEIEFECKAKIEDEENDIEIKDKIDFSVTKKNNRGIVVKVEYEQEMETEEQEAETETQYEVVFDRIIEYAKSSTSMGGPAYDWENDEVVQSMSLADLGDFTGIVNDDSNGGASHFSVATPDGVVSFIFHIHQASQGDSITANKMKIDFQLENFPWQRDDTYVALLSEVETERTIDVEYEDNDDEEEPREVVINFAEVMDDNGTTPDFVPFGEYTWETTAQVNAAKNMTEAAQNVTEAENAMTIEVIATSPKKQASIATAKSSSTAQESTRSEYIAFSFVGDAAKSAPSIFWDPEAGIGYASDAGPASDAVQHLAITLVGAVASIATLVLIIL